MCTADNLCYKMEMGLRGKEKHNKANVSPYLYIYIYIVGTRFVAQAQIVRDIGPVNPI